jgi:sensor histidine kinase YesM
MEKIAKHWIDNPALRILQHLLFWGISFFIFLYIFKIGAKPVKIDYVYAALFHATLLPPVYLNLEILIPRLRRANGWIVFAIIFILLIVVFSWLNMKYFADWSNIFLPEYFFISYFSFFQVAIIFITYMAATSLIKLSKSWFIVNDLQKELFMAERQKVANEKELLELEAKALRAQMNPHFIFNSLNSIKSLIQQNENEKSVTYLTTFSKLIRTLLNNADRKEISLYDEIETCKLYLQLEAMRFDTKFSYAVNVDENIDLKSILVPALIIQPFIENAIWHGIVPRNSGGNVSLNVLRKDGVIEVVIDDDGIGREASAQNKSASGLAHQSKGVNLTQTRLELNNLLQQRQAKLDIIDKKDENAVATGTTVIIKIKEELS